MLRKYLLECIGTFLLVFIVCAAVILNQQPNTPLSAIGVAILFGITLALLTFTFGKATGAHLNPPATLCYAVHGIFPWRNLPAYWLAQLTGAFVAGIVLKVAFPHSDTLGSVLQLKDDTPAFIQEFAQSLLLLVATLSYQRDTTRNRIRSALVTGSIALLICWTASPATGTSMNPARALAPAILSDETTGLWIFLTAPLCAAFAAAGLQALYDMARSKKTAH